MHRVRENPACSRWSMRSMGQGSVALVWILGTWLGWALPAAGQEGSAEPGRGVFEVPLPTLGGLQFWTDEVLFYDWRIQRLLDSDRYRLLDGHDLQLAEGSLADCRARLARLKQQRGLPPVEGRVVLLVHGLARTRHSMDKLARRLAEDGRFTVLQMGYASTRLGIEHHAAALGRIVSELEAVAELNFVAHSMGSLVIRRWLADEPLGNRGRVPLGRMVMLGPPNHGAQRALLWSELPLIEPLFDAVVGRAGRQLGPQFDLMRPHLATPPCPFGIVAGGLGNEHGWHLRIDGDDDGTVGVAETRLDGAADFILLPVRHTQLTSDDRAIDCTLRFLEHGYFLAPEARQPIADAAAAR